MHNPYETPRSRRRRPLAWMVGGGSLTLVCLGLGALAGGLWLRPEAGIIPSPALHQAEVERLNALRDRRSEVVPVQDPAAEPSGPLIPWAWLDEAAHAERLPANASAPSSDGEAAVAASEESARIEQRVYISRGEVQSVAGTDEPDAGVAAAPANAAAAAPSLQPASLQPASLQQQSLPEDSAPEAEAEAEPEEGAAEPTPPPGESCGLVTCEPGYGCCNPSCGVCVAPGDNCDPTPCESRIQYPVSYPCGRSTCSVGELCCNPSCGICVEPDETCDPAPCDNAILYPISPMCGRVTCSVGQLCCNPSCGICVEPGETCSQQWCE